MPFEMTTVGVYPGTRFVVGRIPGLVIGVTHESPLRRSLPRNSGQFGFSAVSLVKSTP